MKRPRVLLADDHVMVAQGLRRLLEPDFEIVGVVSNGGHLLAETERLKPDVLVVDITMPSLNGLEAVRQLKKTDGRAKVIFLTMHTDLDIAAAAFEAGASGYVIKLSAGEELLDAISAVLDGGRYVTPRLEAVVLETFAKRSERSAKRSVQLTPRQREVVQLVGEGRKMKEIASLLNISTRTVKTHKYEVMQRLGLETTADLIQFAVRRGILSP